MKRRASKQKPSKQKPDSKDNECIVSDSGKGREMTFSAKAKNIIMKSIWKQNNEIGKECTT